MKLGEDLSPGGDGQGPRGARPASGSHRRRQRLGHRLAARAGDGRAALSSRGRRRHQALRWRAAPRGAVPPAAAVAGPAAARRADQPPRCRIGGLARALPEGIQGHGRRGHARSLLPGQRGGMDSGAGPRLRHSLEGQLLVLARSEAAAAGAGREVGDEAPEDAAARARMDSDVAARTPVERQGPPQRLRAAAQRGHGAEDRTGGNLHSARPAPRRRRGRGPRPAEGLRRSAADGRPQLHAAARRHRGRHRAQRRRQDHAVPDDHRSGEAGRGHAAPR